MVGCSRLLWLPDPSQYFQSQPSASILLWFEAPETASGLITYPCLKEQSRPQRSVRVSLGMSPPLLCGPTRQLPYNLDDLMNETICSSLTMSYLYSSVLFLEVPSPSFQKQPQSVLSIRYSSLKPRLPVLHGSSCQLELELLFLLSSGLF